MFGRDAVKRAWQFLGGWGSAGIFLLTIAAAGAYLLQLDLRYPVRHWLVWRLLPIWLWTFALNLGLVTAGSALLRWFLPRANVPFSERLVYGLGLGMAAFALLTFGGGALGLFKPWFAVGLVALLLGVGWAEVPALARQAMREGAALSQMGLGQRILGALAFGFTALMLSLVYLEALTPNSFNFDAVWYHVPIAQDYARIGRIVPFFGDNHRAYPHLASLFHTWALLVPGLAPEPLRWILMLHLEFAMVVWRIVGVVAIATYLLGGRRIPGLGAVFFLFPSVFIYDQNIGGSADHVLGASAAPIFLALCRTLPRFHLRFALLTGIFAGVHILTKYQAVYMVFAVAVTVFVRFVGLGVPAMLARIFPGVRARFHPRSIAPRKLWGAPLLILGGALFVSSPHFIKNTIFYQNPVYPFLSKAFPSTFDDWQPPPDEDEEESPAERETNGGVRKRRPEKSAALEGSPQAGRDPHDFRFRSRSFEFKPQGESSLEKVVWVHKTFFDWSFLPGNRSLTQQRPYMGALFTLLLPTLLFLSGASRIWLGLGVSYLAFVAWGITGANDRYLLAFLTLPMGTAAALLVRALEAGRLARLGTSVLVLVQLVWGFDAPFEYGGQRLTDAIALIRSGYRSPSDDARFRYRRSERKLSETLPEDAVVLGRYYKAILGINRTMLNTHPDIQTYIDFKKLTNVRDFWQLCKDRGITHLLYPEGERQPTRAQEAILFDALVEVSPGKERLYGNVVAPLDSEPPADDGPLLVYVQGIHEYQDGVYPVNKLSLDNRVPRPKNPPKPLASLVGASREEIFEKVSALYVRERSLRGDEQSLSAYEFRKVESFDRIELWLKK
jgi:hypothetical protein